MTGGAWHFDPRFFDATGCWHSVAHAVHHAIVVQGGWTTASLEARRMVGDRNPCIDALGRAWLKLNEPTIGLPPDGERLYGLTV